VAHVPGEPRPYAAPYAATAQRPSWPSLPARLRALVQERLGQRVDEALSQGGGFTDGFASRLLLADGSRVFVKAASRLRSPEVFSCYQQEIRVARGLPEDVPAPRLRWALEQEEALVLAFEDIAGRTPQRPWRPEELCAVLDMLTRLATAMTPAPVGLPELDTTAGLDRGFSFWRRLVAADVSADPQLVGARWLARLEDLAALESDWAELAAGHTAVHFDMREDNLLITDDGQVLAAGGFNNGSGSLTSAELDDPAAVVTTPIPTLTSTQTAMRTLTLTPTSTPTATATNSPTLTPPMWIAVAFVSSAVIGIISGFYPAWKASKLDPIEALHYE